MAGYTLNRQVLRETAALEVGAVGMRAAWARRVVTGTVTFQHGVGGHRNTSHIMIDRWSNVYDYAEPCNNYYVVFAPAILAHRQANVVNSMHTSGLHCGRANNTGVQWGGAAVGGMQATEVAVWGWASHIVKDRWWFLFQQMKC